MRSRGEARPPTHVESNPWHIPTMIVFCQPISERRCLALQYVVSENLSLDSLHSSGTLQYTNCAALYFIASTIACIQFEEAAELQLDLWSTTAAYRWLSHPICDHRFPS